MDQPGECQKTQNMLSGSGKVKLDVEDTAQKTNQAKIAGNRYYILKVGKRMDHHLHIEQVFQQMPGLEEVKSVNECGLILVFCPIVSRAGTDINAALNELNILSESKPAIFMVFHHTFDKEKIVPDSSKCVNRPNTFTVDFLFYEDEGLLKCIKNDDSLNRIQQRLQPEACIQGIKNEESWNIMGYAHSATTKFTRTLSSILDYLSLSQTVDLTVASELMIVLLGMSESGKNAVGNMIRKEMHVAGVSTATQKITVDSGTLDKRQVSVIDTPDWFNSQLSLEEMRKNIQRCIRMCSCGPYAVLLVIQVMQFTDKQKKMLENMKMIFQERCWERVMILFVITDEQTEQKIDGFIQQQHLRTLVDNCRHIHIHFFNIAQKGTSLQVSKLLFKIEEMVAGKTASRDDYEARSKEELRSKLTKSKIEQERTSNYIKVQVSDSDGTVCVAESTNSETSDDFEFLNMPEDPSTEEDSILYK